VDFANLFVPLAGPTDLTLDEAKKHGAVIAYGVFVNNLIEFVIIAFSIFIVVRQINRWRGPGQKAA
jgi:large conductance mechanosensitive channel